MESDKTKKITVTMMVNIEFIVKFVINSQKIDFVTTILNHKFTYKIFVKDKN